MPSVLDANAWIGFLRGTSRKLRDRIAAAPPTEVFVCSVVLAELYRGALRGRDPDRERAVVDDLLRPYRSLPFDDDAAFHHAHIRVHLDRLGTPIGPYDLLIAAIARSRGLTVVTHNTGEFNRVPGLAVEDWEAD